MENLYIDTTTRASLAHLTATAPGSLAQMHNAARVDWCAPLVARHIIGRWTVNKLRTLLASDGYDVDADLVIICARDTRPTAPAYQRQWYALTITDGKLDNWQMRRGDYRRPYTDYLDYHTRKSDAEQLRKSEWADTIIIAQHPEQLTAQKPRPRINNNARYNVLGVTYARGGDGERIVSRLKITARTPGHTYSGEIVGGADATTVEDIIDKSGYVVSERRYDLKRRANAVRADKARREFEQIDTGTKLAELAELIAARRAEIAAQLATATTSDALDKIASKLAHYSGGLARALRLYERIAERCATGEGYKSPETFAARCAEVVECLTPARVAG